MGKLISSTAVTVDGVMDVGEWFVAEGDRVDASRAQFDDAVMVMGRKTYEGLAGHWPTVEGPWADKLNPMPKYVASRTQKGPLEWNSALLEGESAEAVTRLKDELDGNLILVGTGELARHLPRAGVVDELRFWVHPSLWGKGERPFNGEETVRLNLLEAKPFESGVLLLRYEAAAVG